MTSPKTDLNRTARAQAPPANARAVLLLMCAGMFLVLLDVTIVNVALPSIGRGLHTGVPSLQWVVDGYAVAIAALLLAGGTLGDRWGHRQMVLLGFGLFAAASVACASAPDPALLIGGRVVQGIGGAVLLPATMAIIADSFPERGPQARALGTWAAVSSLALPAGPVLGGLLAGSIGWRWIFWINVPLIIGTVLAVRVVVPARPGQQAGSLDRLGLILMATTFAALVFAIIETGRGSPLAFAGAVVAVVAATLGVRTEARSAHPILPVDLLRTPAFAAPNLVALTMNLVFNGTLFVATLYLQDVRHLSPIQAGLLVLPMAVPLVALAPISGRLTAAYGPRLAIVLGAIVATAGSLLLLVVDVSGSPLALEVCLGVLGCGAGLVTASVVAAVVRATPRDRSGLATGMSNTARQVGTATGVAIFGAVAGSPMDPAHFVRMIHVLGVVAAGLWLLALAATVVGVDRVDSA